MKRTGALARRTPLKAKTQLRRTAAPKKRPRSKSETERVYGSKAFRDFLHSSCCLWCGRTTGIEQAHLRGNGGLGRKGGWEGTGPLCGPILTRTLAYPGCHARWDRRAPERFWLTDAQRTSILRRLDAFHEAWKRRSTT